MTRLLSALTAARVHALVVERYGRYEHMQGGRALAQAYQDLAVRLPQWLHHNGLKYTLDYLKMRADGRGEQAAQDLLDDWLRGGTGTDEGLQLHGLVGGPQKDEGRSEYRMALRLALAEADWFKLFAQSELVAETVGADNTAAAHVAG